MVFYIVSFQLWKQGFSYKTAIRPWNKIVLPVGGGLTAVLSIFLLVLSLRSNSDLMALLLVIVLFGGGITLVLTSVDEWPKKKARQKRSSESESKDKFGAWNEQGYKERVN